MTAPIKIIFGTAAPWSLLPPEEGKEFFPVLKRHNVDTIDTASIYFGSEKSLGILGAPSQFTICTKAPGLAPGCLSKDSIRAASEKSFAELGVESVDVYFLHSPDPAGTSIAETMEAVQELYIAGRFKRFGLSNFTAAGVQEVHDYCSSKGFVLPTVFEGNYSPITRHLEKDIFPLIRNLKMSFYAYSPLAGGFLVKSAEVIKEAKEARWNTSTRVGAMYQKMYNRPGLLAALTDWEAIANEAGVSKAALAYKWVVHHSELSSALGDGIIVGASRPSQLDDTLNILESGPLDPDIVLKVGELWEKVKAEAPVDNVQM